MNSSAANETVFRGSCRRFRRGRIGWRRAFQVESKSVFRISQKATGIRALAGFEG